ncbi:hypothetical protein V1512DRAFT_261495, partial [Lipomyces arxii]|uniref:uncharacterized protein n=1 Tax=Lipomyces arxii TaxID=56418 RepID=UPI0034CFEBBA
MLKSRRLTTLLSQSLSPLSPPIDTFQPASPGSLQDSVDSSSTPNGDSHVDSLVDASKLPVSNPTPKVVMTLLLTTNGNLLASSSLSGSHSTPYSLALSPSVSQLSTSGGSHIGNSGGSVLGGSGMIVGSIGTNGAIHLSDLSPKPRVYASYAANLWRSYTKAATSTGLFDESAVDTTVDTTVDWVAVENEESTIVIKYVPNQMLLALIGERGTSVGLLFARASAMADTLAAELKGFTF